VDQFIKSLEGLNYKDGHTVLNKNVRAIGENIPPLVNAYMNLSSTMKTFGTSTNPTFGDVEILSQLEKLSGQPIKPVRRTKAVAKKPVVRKTNTKKETQKEKQKEIIPLSIDALLENNVPPITIPTSQQDPTANANPIPNLNPDKIIPKNLNYNTPITQIYHISDLHIQLYKRHNEYQSVFNRVYEYLKEEKVKYNVTPENNTQSPLIVIVTGDILHSKSDLSPECIQMTYNFIKTISSIMPLVLIPGNHDINMNNRDRLDSLTPIIADLPTSYPIYYLIETGVYQMSNILFYHASIFDYKIIHPNQVAITPSPITSIMLYHGRVNGAVLFNGMEFMETIPNQANSQAKRRTRSNRPRTPRWRRISEKSA
jgi:predicted MPP superfamily phosphohydrolase